MTFLSVTLAETKRITGVNPVGSAIFEGTAKVNGEEGFKFIVSVEDNGEPGTNDRFQIEIWAGTVDTENSPPPPEYLLKDTLGGGNIQIHQ